jgi:hypothetical protein
LQPLSYGRHLPRKTAEGGRHTARKSKAGLTMDP